MKIEKIITENAKELRTDVRRRFFIAPERVIKVWGDVTSQDSLIGRSESQVLFNSPAPVCVMKNTGAEHAAMLIDYGCEIHGDVRIVTERVWNSHDEVITAGVRVRFGESIAEALLPVGTKGATNDHATRDGVIGVSQWAAQETGETGFRYMYIELLDDDATVKIKSLTGVLIVNHADAVGSFECDDERLTRIWQTAAYTVYLNMQEYLWDGVKRDRAVWFGDMNTEVETVLAVFGDIDVVRRSLDFGYETTPLPRWMNGIPSYSFWWLINLMRVYEYSGDEEFLLKYKQYIKALAGQINGYIDEHGRWTYEGRNTTFIDWSTRSDPDSQLRGFMGLLSYTLDIAARLLSILGEDETASECLAKREVLKNNAPAPTEQKIATALLSLGELADAHAADEYIEKDGVAGYSTFMGYSILNAKAKADNLGGAIDAIRDYWGAMLDLGATSFWEDFDIEWAKHAPIDEIPREGELLAHGDFGRHCYVGLRLSLCHGWSAGPCPWLTKYVLGVNIEECGMRKIRIKPYLGDMKSVRGSVPTPYGKLTLSHTVRDGVICTSVDAPKEIEIIYEGCVNE